MKSRTKGLAAVLCCLLAAAASGDGVSLDVARSLNEQGRYPEAEAVAREQLASLEAEGHTASEATGEALDQLVDSLVGGGRTGEDETLELAQRSASLWSSLRGDESPEAAAALARVGRVLKGRGELQAARDTQRRVLELRESALGHDHPDVARSLIAVGHLELILGDGESAVERYRRAREIFERADGPRSRGVALALRMEADYHLDRLELQRAIELHEQSLAIRLEVLGPDHPELAMNHNNIGMAQVRLGRYAEAADAYAEAARIWEGALGPDHPRVGTPLLNRGRLFWFGELEVEEARGLFERALAIQEAALGAGHPEVADVLENLGGLLHYTGDYAASLPYFERALSIREKAEGPRSLRVAGSLVNMAQFDLEMGDVERAVPRLERAVRIYEESLGPDDARLATPLRELGAIHLLRGELDRAAPLLERAVAVLENAPAGVVVSRAAAFHTLARLRVRTGRPEEAIRLDRMAIALREETLGADSPLLAASLVRAAENLRTQGRAEEARALLERARAILEAALGTDHPRTLRVRHALALLAARGPHRDGALEEALRVESGARDHLRLALRGLSERQALGYAAGRTSGLDLAVSLVADAPVEDGGRAPDAAAVWDAVVRSRALVLDEMASRHRSVAQSENPELAGLFAELGSVRNRLAYLALRPSGRLGPAAYRERLRELETRRERLEAELGRRSTAFRATVERDRIGLIDALAHLPESSALAAYLRYEHLDADDSRVPSYAVFVQPPGDRDPMVLRLGTAADIERLVEAVRGEQGSRPAPLGRLPRERGAALALRKVIWDPIAEHIGGAHRLFVVPDGALHGIGLAALPVDGRYLVEAGPTLHYLSTERDLVRTADDGSVATGTLLAMGAPDFGSRARTLRDGSPPWARDAIKMSRSGNVYRGPRPSCGTLSEQRFEPLPESRVELESVSSLWANRSSPGGESVLTLLDAEARESFFKRLAPGRGVLHLATHAFFAEPGCEAAVVPSMIEPLEEVPYVRGDSPLLLSGLVLAGANERPDETAGEEDGILTAEEIAALDLSSVEWAVLSGCDTGRGDIVAGEGVLGLRRAFEIAGADTLVLSLWRVDDAAARRWMLALYEGRLEGLSTADAVRRASLDVITARREAGLDPHPFYWAGFVATGDWR